MRHRTLVLVGLLLLSFQEACWCGWAQQMTTPAPVADPAGVQSFLTAWVAAWNAHDAKAILRLHAGDCTTVNRTGTVYLDKAALKPQMEMLQNVHFKGVQWPAFRLLNERSLAPGLVVVQVLWPQLTTMMPPPWPKVGDMIITLLLKKSGDGWVAEQVDTHDVFPRSADVKP
jgi:uncharacterized protein (TIGR02246 family)